MYFRRVGKGWKVPRFRETIRACRLLARLASNMPMLTLSTPAAPRLRLTRRNAWCINGRVIRPVSEWCLMFSFRSPSISTYPHLVGGLESPGRAARGKCCLARLGLPARGRAGATRSHSMRLTALMVRRSVVSSSRSPLSSSRTTTPGGLPSPRRRRLGRLLRAIAWTGPFVLDL